MNVVTMTQALKKLYKAVVGEDTTKNNPTKIVNDLADNYSGGGSGGSLPSVTASDNGMVLTVVEGSWDKAASSGGGVLMLHDNGHLDKTMGEIITAAQSGVVLMLEFPVDDSFEYYQGAEVHGIGSIYMTVAFNGSVIYEAASVDDYPTLYT